MNYFTYMLECTGGGYYTGWTDDLDKRIASHSAGTGAKYTRSHPPVALVAFWQFPSRSEAMKEEWRIKQLSRKEKQLLVSACNQRRPLS